MLKARSYSFSNNFSIANLLDINAAVITSKIGETIAKKSYFRSIDMKIFNMLLPKLGYLIGTNSLRSPSKELPINFYLEKYLIKNQAKNLT